MKKISYFVKSFLLLILTETLQIAYCSCPFHHGPVSLPTKQNKNAPIDCSRKIETCPETNYRSYDGSCNNLLNPSLGTPETTYGRLLPPNYGDGISSPTLAVSGKELPNARKVSLNVYPDVEIQDPLWTLITMQYGQFISHDTSLLLNNAELDCCNADAKSEFCYSIEISDSDPIFSKYGVDCIPLSRTITDKDRNCSDKKTAEQLTSVNHFLDLSLVYGNSDDANEELRDSDKKKLKSLNINEEEFLPFDPDGSCAGEDDEPCFLSGDSRVNQNVQLTGIHTIFLREHNRLAQELSVLNPKWDDERIFQEARKICIAVHQYISYYEWLPIIIGSDKLYESNILYNTTGFVNDYDSTVNPSIFNEHATAAFRFFHTSIAGYLYFYDESRVIYGVTRISDHWFRPTALINFFDDLTRSLVTQPQLFSDAYHDKEITKDWARQPNASVGQDLKTICISRGRDHGMASYNDFREFCGLPRARSFDDFRDVMSLTDVIKLTLLYEIPDDVELTVGGSLETILPTALTGPTFQCILTKQFYQIRKGDRFWFENSGPTGFTLDQLNEIRKASIARLICDNTKTIEKIQARAFEQISLENVLVSCKELPSIDLTLWCEDG